MQRFVSVNRALLSASGSGMAVSHDATSSGTLQRLTFGLVELGVESQANFRGAHVHQLVLVVLRRSQLANDFS